MICSTVIQLSLYKGSLWSKITTIFRVLSILLVKVKRSKCWITDVILWGYCNLTTTRENWYKKVQGHRILSRLFLNQDIPNWWTFWRCLIFESLTTSTRRVGSGRCSECKNGGYSSSVFYPIVNYKHQFWSSAQLCKCIIKIYTSSRLVIVPIKA